ncbi:MAG: DNRLRE domain-containing protein, partial [Lachnospiraceae bacterium]|nr:DNRLRE domain-containing protein [Lachnospiraceae bacterium]
MRRKTKLIGKRLISILLTVSLLLQMLPGELQAHASELSEEESTLQMSGDRALAEVIGEVESLRQESVKHFRLSDGSYLAVSYGLPVHYLDEEESWQDIDNTMVLTNNENGTMAYRAANADVMSAFSATLSTGQLLSAQRDGYGVSMSLLDTAQAGQMIQMTTSSSVSLVGPIVGSGDNAEGLVYDRTVTAQLVSTGGAAGDAVLYGLQTDEDTAGWTADDIMPQNLTSSILYEDVYADVDILYTAYSHNIKEEILIKEPMSSYRFDFLLNLDGLSVILNEDGSVSLTNSAQQEIYQIPVPYMKDGEGEISHEVAYTLIQTADGVIFTITADAQWINSPDRVFPVSIDPSLVVGANGGAGESAGIYASYASERNPDSVGSNYDHINAGLREGGEQYQTFMYFNYLPEIPTGAMVTGAMVGTHMNRRSMVDCTEFYVGLYEVTGALPSSYTSYYEWYSNLTWNNKPAFDGENTIDFVGLHGDKMDQYNFWDMTELIKKWYLDDDIVNRAVALAATDRDEDHVDTYKAYGSFQGYDMTYPPALVIAYRSTVGMEPYYTYSSYYAGEAGMAYVADGTGQLKVVKELFTY